MVKHFVISAAVHWSFRVVSLANIGAAIPAIAADARMNIVWIVADDLSPELGCYGYPHVRTPHIDALAKDGVVFQRAFATAPVCSSSRSAFITGRYQTSIASYHHRTEDPKPLPPDVKTLPSILQAAGYFVSNSQDAEGRKWGKTDYNFTYDAREMYDGSDWRKRKPGRPFFAQVQIKEPHRPFVNQPVTEKRHLDAPMPPIYPEHPLARRDWQAYLQSIEALDAKVGEVLSLLAAEGVVDNTAVFFFGDHGRPHVRDKQWLYDGGLGVPLIVRWPGKVQPGTVREELVSLLDLAPTCIALAGMEIPSGMHGRPLFSAGTAGRDFIAAARDRCGDADDRIRCVRTADFKYIRNFRPEIPHAQHSSYKEVQYPMLPLMRKMHAAGELSPAQALFFAKVKPAEELYDLRQDPWEMLNLASDPAHAKTLEDLRGKLTRWMEETGDQGATVETTPTLAEIVADTRRTTFDKPNKQRGLPATPSDDEVVRWWESHYEK